MKKKEFTVCQIVYFIFKQNDIIVTSGDESVVGWSDDLDWNGSD